MWPRLTLRPYIKGLPVTLTTSSILPNGDAATTITRPTYEDPYTLQLRQLYSAVADGKEYKTTVVDGRQDTELSKMIMDALVDRSH